MSKLTVYFMQGLPGSGKSYEAKKIVAKDKTAVRVNKDDIRELLSHTVGTLAALFDATRLASMLFGIDSGNVISKEQLAYATQVQNALVAHFKSKESDVFNKKDGKLNQVESLTLEIEDVVIKFAVSTQKNIVVDDTNYHPKHLQRVQNFCKGYKINIIDMHKDFKITLKQCLERNKNRSRKVPEFVIHGMAKQYNVFNAAASTDKPYVTENRVIIVDVDGTIADISHRAHLVKNKNVKPDWNKFFSLMTEDTCRAEVKSLIDDTYPDHDVIIVSGRPDNYKQTTEDWLKKHNVRYNAIYMRRANDRRPDYIVKQEILDRYLPKDQIDAVIDDRPSVLRQWASNGLQVIDVGNGIEF